MRTITYRNKSAMTSAQYRNIKFSDREFILEHLQLICDYYDSCMKEGYVLQTARLDTENKQLPRQGKKFGTKKNSIITAARGIIENFSTGTQRDFTDSTCNLVSAVFNLMAELIDHDWPQVEFVKEDVLATTAPKDRFQHLFQ